MFDVKFIEALAYSLSRNYVLGDEYYIKMTEIQRKQSVSIAGLAQLEHVKHVMDEVQKSIDGGGTFRQFQDAVNSGDIDVGLPKHRLDNIFRTNIQSAYNHGRWQQQQKTKAYRPYRIYDAVNDNRTRPAHRELDNIIRPIDDPWWNTHTPPMGYRCRCTTRSLTEAQALEKGITPVEDLPEGGRDSEDWGQSPALYNDKMEKVINQRIAELMVEYFKNKTAVSELKQASVRIKEAIQTVLSQPIPDLALQIAEAKKLLGKEVEQNPKGAVFAEFKDLVIDENEVKRLLIDPLDNKEKLAEAMLAAEIQAYFNVRLNRFEPVYKDGKPIPNPDFINVATGETLDFMFAMNEQDDDRIVKLNKFFAHTDKQWEKKKTDIQEHLDKADIVPLDLRYLYPDNKALLIAYVLSLPVEQQQQIILVMGDKS